jgi:hypothetical protein
VNVRHRLIRRERRQFLAACLLLCCPVGLISVVEARASVRTIQAEGEYRMNPRDTRENAERLASEAAKRNALEQVAVYIESVTVSTNFDVTLDEIRSYTAGVVSVQDQRISSLFDGDAEVIHVDLTAEVDSDQAVRAITALRQDENAQREVLAPRAEVDRLHTALEETNLALTAATAPSEIRTLAGQRQQLLNQMQSNTMLAQAWTNFVIVTAPTVPTSDADMRRVLGLVTQARRLNPVNPHLGKLHGAITAQPASPKQTLPPASPLQPLQPPQPLTQPSMTPLRPPQPMQPPAPMPVPSLPHLQPPQPLTPRQ